ncbi:MAG TPA: hypothetical protein VHZ24_13910 [Pirellulales bacterium]|jgi:Flp pilus assembly protein TadG|nr:hypothetical protein [Pirellulales bacterium]
MVEGAVVLAVLTLFVFSGMELGMVVMRCNSLGEGSRRAARAAIVRRKQASQLGALGPQTLACSAADSNAVAQAINGTLATTDPTSVQIQVAWLDGDNDVDDRVQVTLQYQHQMIVPAALGWPCCCLRCAGPLG